MDGTGAGDFLTIQEAVDAASNDDTLLIKAGDYAGFTVEGKALQVVAESGQQVRVTEYVYIANQEDRDDVYLSGLTANYRLGQLGNPVGGVHGGLILLEHGQSLDPAGPGFGYGVRVHGLTRGFTAVSSTSKAPTRTTGTDCMPSCAGGPTSWTSPSTTPCFAVGTVGTASAGAASTEGTGARARGWARGACSRSVSRSSRASGGLSGRQPRSGRHPRPDRTAHSAGAPANPTPGPRPAA